MDSLDKEKWGMVITHESDDGLVVTFDVFSPPTASIGRFAFAIGIFEIRVTKTGFQYNVSVLR